MKKLLTVFAALTLPALPVCAQKLQVNPWTTNTALTVTNMVLDLVSVGIGGVGGATNGIQMLDGYGTNTTLYGPLLTNGTYYGNGAGLTNVALTPWTEEVSANNFSLSNVFSVHFKASNAVPSRIMGDDVTGIKVQTTDHFGYDYESFGTGLGGTWAQYFIGNGGGLTNLPLDSVSGLTNALDWLTNNAGGGVVTNLSEITNIASTVSAVSSNELYWAGATNENRYYLKRDFGAAGDGMVALMCSGTAGTNVLNATSNMLGSTTVFVGGDVGKAVTIYGAGDNNGNGYALNVSCYITQYLSATAVKISSNIVTTFSQRSAVFGTDDTDNIQAAFNFFTNSPRASMELFCEQGIYVVAGPLLDVGTNYNHKNAQVIFPAVPRDGQHMRRFAIRGVGPSNQRGQINMNTNLVTGYDSIWWSFVSRGDPQHGGRMMDFQNSDPATTCGLWSIPNELGGTTAHTRLNGVMVRVTDMGFRACYDADIGVLDLHGASGAEIERVSVSTGYGTSNPWCTGMTGTNGYGVHGAGHFNENPNTVHQVQIHNMYTGLRASENIWSGHLWLSGCYNGIDVQGGGAQMVFDWINMHAPYNAFYSWGSAANVYAPNLLIMDDVGLPGGAPFLVKELNTNSPALAGYIRYSFSESGATAGLLPFDGGAASRLKYEIFGADTPALNMQLSKHSVSNNVNALNFRLFGSVSPSITFSASNEANVATSPMFKIGTHQGLGLSSQFTIGSDQTSHEYFKALLSGNVSMGVPTKTTTIYGNTSATGTFSGTLSGNLGSSSNLPPTTGIAGWPANAAGVLENNGSGTLSWGAGGGGGVAVAAGDNIFLTTNSGVVSVSGTVDTNDARFTVSTTITNTSTTFRTPTDGVHIFNNRTTSDEINSQSITTATLHASSLVSAPKLFLTGLAIVNSGTVTNTDHIYTHNLSVSNNLTATGDTTIANLYTRLTNATSLATDGDGKIIDGVYKSQDIATNTWTANTAFLLSTNVVISSGAATLGFTGVAGVPTTGVSRYGELKMVCTGAVTLTNPAGIYTSDQLDTRTFPSGTLVTVSVEVTPGIYTNMVYVTSTKR